jgi:hypothetical protein
MIEIPQNDPRGVAWQVQCKINELIGAFVRSNEDNQLAIFNAAITVIMESVGLATGGAPTLTCLFGGNTILSKSTQAKTLITMMGKKLEGDGSLGNTHRPDKDPQGRFFLEYFAEVCYPQHQAVRTNQDTVMEMLDYRPTLRILFDEGFVEASNELSEKDLDAINKAVKKEKNQNPKLSKRGLFDRKRAEMEVKKVRNAEGYNHLIDLVKQFHPAAARKARRDHDHTNSAGIATCQVEYHIRFIQLLGNLSKGLHTRNEMKTQQMFPFKRVMAVLLDPIVRTKCAPMKLAYMQLLTDAYFETEIEPPKPLYEEEVLWWLFEVLVAELEEIKKDIEPHTTTGTPLFVYMFEGLVPCFTEYFLHVHNPEAIFSSSQNEVKDRIKTCAMELYEMPEIKASVSCLVSIEGLLRSMGFYIEDETRMFKSKRGTAMKADSDKTELEKLITAMNNDPRFVQLIREENRGAVETLINADRLTNPCDPDYMELKSMCDDSAVADNRKNVITFEMVCERITQHINDNPLSEACTRMLALLANVIDFYLPANSTRDPVTFQLEEQEVEITDAILAEQQVLYKSFQNQMDEYGVTELAIDMIGLSCPRPGQETAAEDERAVNAMKLLIAVMEGGNKDVQTSFLKHMKKHPKKAEAFFSKMAQRLFRYRKMVEELKEDFENEENIALREGKTMGIMPSRWLKAETRYDHRRISVDLTNRVLQLLCEGHNHELQALLRNQSSIEGLVRNTNMLDVAVKCLQALLTDDQTIAKLSEDNCEDACQFLDLFTEMMQGPNHENQIHIAKSYVVDISIAVLSQTRFEYLSENLQNDLMDSAAVTLYTLIEGRVDHEVHHLVAEKFDCSLFVERIGAIQHAEELRLKDELGPDTITAQVIAVVVIVAVVVKCVDRWAVSILLCLGSPLLIQSRPLPPPPPPPSSPPPPRFSLFDSRSLVSPFAPFTVFFSFQG